MAALKGWLTATFNISPLLSGLAVLNTSMELDVYAYFRTEDNKHFLITESGDHLVI
jgi:hypothetical protein